MSIATQITRIKNAKNSIITDLKNKGIEVSDTAKIDELPSIVETIEIAKPTQTKSITITENGTQTITPDDDKSLSSVEITTNVSGGGVDEYFNEEFNLSSASAYTSIGRWLDCIKKLPALTIKPYNTSYMSYAFSGYPLEELDLSNVQSTKATQFNYMFYNCKALKKIDFSKLDTSSAKTYSNMFYNCSSLEELDLSSFGTSNLSTGAINNMFYNCIALKKLKLPAMKVQNYASDGNIFNNCSSLEELDFSNVKFDSTYGMFQYFYNCNSLKKLDFSNTTNKTLSNLNNAFYNCYALEEINWGENFATTNNMNLSGAFYNCQKLSEINLSFIQGKVTNITNAFYGCLILQNIDLSNADLSSCTSYTNTFNSVPTDCYILMKDEANKTWLTSKFTTLTNVHYVGEE